MIKLTRIRPSDYFEDFDNPTKEELLFMYQWLINSSKNFQDYERVKELQLKYDAIAKADKVTTYTIKNGISALISYVGGLIPSLNIGVDTDGNVTNVFAGNKITFKLAKKYADDYMESICC